MNRPLILKTGLNAVVGENPKFLILGTLPGDESIRKQEYYSQARNRFWKIIFGLFSEQSVPFSYADRIDFLKQHGIAIWDMLSKGVREGSLDASIKNDIPNDIESFLRENPTIEVIGLNGTKAEKYFNQYFSGLLKENKPRVTTLLSSSGANCRFSISELQEDWGNKLGIHTL